MLSMLRLVATIEPFKIIEGAYKKTHINTKTKEVFILFFFFYI